jgi:antitoxin ParD1/3/4
MNIQLKPNQEKFIEEQLKSDRFNNVEQLIDTALHLGASHLCNKY